MPLLLASRSLEGLSAWLDAQGAGTVAAVVTSASRGLADRNDIIDPAESEIRGGGREARRVDLFDEPTIALDVATIVLTGGDPFALLGAIRQSGADRWLQRAHRRGVPIVGQSAGAMVCGPTLEPMRLTSPFTVPAGAELTAVGLTEHVILPHHDTPGRSSRHREAAIRFGRSLTLTPLDDEEFLSIEGSTWNLHHGRFRTRLAELGDAEPVARLFQAAAVQAWSPFLGRDRLAAAPLDIERWQSRIADAAGRFLVTEDDGGLLGFVLWGAATDPGLDGTVGEIDLLYTHPRAWGWGCGRRLLERALWALTGGGHREGVLWTEHRNERALAVYRAAGWRLDGAERTRDYRGVTIRELRHRLAL
jgi:dipeptidase E